MFSFSVILSSRSLRVAILRLTMPSRGGTEGKVKKHTCLGLPEAIALEQEQGNHTPSPGAKLRQEEGLRWSGSGVS